MNNAFLCISAPGTDKHTGARAVRIAAGHLAVKRNLNLHFATAAYKHYGTGC